MLTPCALRTQDYRAMLIPLLRVGKSLTPCLGMSGECGTMNLASKLSLAAAGVFLLTGMLLGIVKYRRIMTSPQHRAPVYIDIAHRAAFLYSFAALVIARLVEYSPYSATVQLTAALVPLVFFAMTITGYAAHGFKNDTENMFSERNLITTWFMYALIAGEIGGMSIILWGFVQTQLLK